MPPPPAVRRGCAVPGSLDRYRPDCLAGTYTDRAWPVESQARPAPRCCSFPGGLLASGSASTTMLVAGIRADPARLRGAGRWDRIRQRRQASKVHPIVSAAVQQSAAGAAFIAPALLQTQATHWTVRGIEATLYLTVFGGIIGYTAYVITDWRGCRWRWRRFIRMSIHWWRCCWGCGFMASNLPCERGSRWGLFSRAWGW